VPLTSRPEPATRRTLCQYGAECAVERLDRSGPALGLEAPSGAAGSGAGRRSRRRAAADVFGQWPAAQANPRLGEDLRAVLVAALRSVGCCVGRTQRSEGGR